MPLRGVIFDFDGVIADTEPLHLKAFQAVLTGGPLSLSQEAYLARYLGFDDAGVFRALAGDRGVALLPNEVARLVEAKGRRYAELVATGDVVFRRRGSASSGSPRTAWFWASRPGRSVTRSRPF